MSTLTITITILEYTEERARELVDAIEDVIYADDDPDGVNIDWGVA